MKTEARNKWDRNATQYDFWEWGGARRHAPYKRLLLGRMQGRVLFVAAGTGTDFYHFPGGIEIVAIDLSGKMLERAAKRAAAYQGHLALAQCDVQRLPFPDATFDTVATSCTFCSVPNPLKGLAELHRVLRPLGKLLMFEHVRSQNGLAARIQDFMTFFTRRYGPEMNRRTAETVLKTGFKIEKVEKAYLDVFLSIEARKDPNTVLQCRDETLRGIEPEGDGPR